MILKSTFHTIRFWALMMKSKLENVENYFFDKLMFSEHFNMHNLVTPLFYFISKFPIFRSVIE